MTNLFYVHGNSQETKKVESVNMKVVSLCAGCPLSAISVHKELSHYY